MSYHRSASIRSLLLNGEVHGQKKRGSILQIPNDDGSKFEHFVAWQNAKRWPLRARCNGQEPSPNDERQTPLRSQERLALPTDPHMSRHRLHLAADDVVSRISRNPTRRSAGSRRQQYELLHEVASEGQIVGTAHRVSGRQQGLGVPDAATLDDFSDMDADDVRREFIQSTDDGINEKLTLLQKFVRTVLPHLGLIVLTSGFTLLGASIFYSVERPNELNVKRQQIEKLAKMKSGLLLDMWQLARRNETSQNGFNRLGGGKLDDYAQQLFQAYESQLNFTEIKTNQTNEIWTFPTAVFFAVTCLSTIGYGNPVPVTHVGRIICLFFSLFGVPLTLLTIANVGKFLGEHLIWLYGCYLSIRLKCGKELGRLRKSIKEKTKGQWPILMNGNAKVGPSVGHSGLRGSRHKRRRQRRRRAKKNSKSIAEDVDVEGAVQRNSSSLLADRFENVLNGAPIQEKTVPALLLLGILIGYTALGGVLLRGLENWTFFEAFYFSFITMTTIGFGDLVPAKGANIVLILLYIIFGLVITTMCIDLVGVHYVRKIHYFGRKIQDARSAALAIVGGRVVYIGDLYAQLLAARRSTAGLAARQSLAAAWPDDACALLYAAGGAPHAVPFVPNDIGVIRYIDRNSELETLTDGSADSSQLEDYGLDSCRYCRRGVDWRSDGCFSS